MENEKQDKELQAKLDRQRSKREDLINSEEYKNADSIQKQQFLLALQLRELLYLD